MQYYYRLATTIYGRRNFLARRLLGSFARDEPQEGSAVLADDGGTDAGDGQQALLVARLAGGDGDQDAVGQDVEGRHAAALGLGAAPGAERRPQVGRHRFGDRGAAWSAGAPGPGGGIAAAAAAAGAAAGGGSCLPAGAAGRGRSGGAAAVGGRLPDSPARRDDRLLGDLDAGEQGVGFGAKAFGGQADPQEANRLPVLGEGVFLHLDQAAAAEPFEQQLELFALQRGASGALAEELAGALAAAPAERLEQMAQHLLLHR